MSELDRIATVDAEAERDDGRLAVETGGVLAAHVAEVGLRYVGSVFATRALGASWFGSFTLGLTIVTVLGMVSTMGVSPGVLPFLARAARAGRSGEVRAVVRAAWIVVAVAAVPITLLLFALGPWIGRAVFDDPQLAEILRPLCLFVVVSSLLTASTALVQGLFGAREQALLEKVLVTAVTVVGLGLAWSFELGIRGVVAATLAGASVGLGASVLTVLRRVPGSLALRVESAPPPVRSLTRESWPLMGVGLFAFILTFMDILLMGVFRGSEDVGVYGACARLAPAVILIPNAVGPVLLARLGVLSVEGDWASIESLYKTTARWSLWAGLCIACAFLVFGREILALFGPEFVAGASVLSLLTLARAATATTGLSGRILSITGKARANLVNMVLLVGFNLVLDLLWIPRYGGPGAAAATCLSVSVVKLVQTVQVFAFFHIQPFTLESLWGLLGVGGLALLTAWLHGEHSGGVLWLGLLASYLVGCAALYLGIGADADDKAFLRRLLRLHR